MSDVIRRMALHEPLTSEEEDACCRIMSSGNLYVIITAAFRKAEAEGFRCNLSLNRKPRPPQKRSRARKRPI